MLKLITQRRHFLTLILLGSFVLAPFTFSKEKNFKNIPRPTQIKAAYLFKFIKYISWPKGIETDSSKPLIIGVVSPGPMYKALLPIHGKEINGKKIIVKEYKKYSDVKYCHILFFNETKRGLNKNIVKELSKIGTLTIGEEKNFIQNGGILNFLKVGKKIRFEINIQSSDKAGLKISSKLLMLSTFTN